MRMRVDDIAFDSPPGLEDASSYGFKARGVGELAVEFELPVGGKTPAAEILADERRGLGNFLGGDLAIDEEGELTLLGQPAPFLRFHIDGQSRQGMTVVANLDADGSGPGDWLKLAFTLEAAADQVRAAVDPVLASFARGDQPAPAPAAAGWIRRQAGPWAFDLPAAYAGPRVFVWEQPDDEWRVQLRVHHLDAQKPDLDRRLATYQGRGMQISDREDVPIIHGELVRVELVDDLQEAWFACCSAQGFEVGNPIQIRYVEVEASSPKADREPLRKLVDALLASINVEARP